MTVRTLVRKELCQRPMAMLASLLSILLGVAALVAIRHVAVFSEREVGRQLESLGANILVLPKGATLQSYYTADGAGQTLPEEHVALIMLAGLPGVEKLSPKLCLPAEVQGRTVTLTGILPQQDMESQAAWQTVTLLHQRQHVGCTRARTAPPQAIAPESLGDARTIQRLAEHEVVIGVEVAESMRLARGSRLSLLGESFEVLAVMNRSGTVDDSRVFAHLHTVQRLANRGEVVSAIEVLGCCEDAAGQLVPKLAELLPDAKVVTISQMVETQVGVNRLLARSSVLVLGVLVLAGGASVMTAISSNVRERRREIGTLMALGASPSDVARLFLLKATWLGLTGGAAGCVVGIVLGMTLGEAWAGVRVTPLLDLAGIAVAAALGVTLTAAYWPSRQAARLDPCACFQEI